LLDFLDGPARRARSLFILGDLFEAWIGDDAATDPAPAVARHLNALAASGVAISFIAGNRDFLLGDDYCRQAGMTRLQEPFLLDELSPPALLMHGDTLCTDDLAYQRFRRKVRNHQWQRRVLSRPIWWRRMLARLARLISRRQNRNKAAAIMDVNHDAVIDCMRTHGISRLIHGHTHRPAIHAVTIDDRPGQRVVLGDWHGEQGSVVRLASGRVELLKVVRGGTGEVEFEAQAVGHGTPDYSVDSSK
jgi:UDP-2,3-diacylglucosamine hydrolase